jgi:SAM-dependent methyltransferase
VFKIFDKLKGYLNRPEPYTPSTGAFWDDEHISKGMLEAHLDPNTDSATRKYDFVEKSTNWIASKFSATDFPRLLDLGCGPGIYAEKFLGKGYDVNGLDFSKRSINYANESARRNNFNIKYEYGNYLEIPYVNEFDIITLIWCDFGALPPEDREKLLRKVLLALKINGVFIFDVFSDKVFETKSEEKKFDYMPQSGFWSGRPHLKLGSTYKYDGRIFVDQSIIIEQEKINCYNIWEHYFTKDELIQDLSHTGFVDIDVYAGVDGAEYEESSQTICLTSRKI